ncbi:MAG: STAS domain-containing protein [Fibrobacterota bacterium]
MGYETKAIKKVTVVYIPKEIMQEDVPELRTVLSGVLASGCKGVVLDMTSCPYITSTGLSAIFHEKKRFVEAGGDIKIASINALIQNLLDLTNLAKAIEIFNQVQEAVDSF